MVIKGFSPDVLSGFLCVNSNLNSIAVRCHFAQLTNSVASYEAVCLEGPFVMYTIASLVFCRV